MSPEKPIRLIFSNELFAFQEASQMILQSSLKGELEEIQQQLEIYKVKI